MLFAIDIGGGGGMKYNENKTTMLHRIAKSRTVYWRHALA